jgi:hypothetical protein
MRKICVGVIGAGWWASFAHIRLTAQRLTPKSSTPDFYAAMGCMR